jgi:hypothetical protein
MSIREPIIDDHTSEYILYICDKYKVPEKDCEDIVSSAIKISKIYDMDLHLLLAMIEVESGFRTRVRSAQNARGLLGVRAKTQYGYDVWEKELITNNIISCENDLYKPYNNIHAGVFIFQTLLDTHNNNVDKALCSYLGKPSSSYLYSIKSKMKVYKVIGHIPIPTKVNPKSTTHHHNTKRSSSNAHRSPIKSRHTRHRR